MTQTQTKEIQKREALERAERTRPGQIFTPAVDIFEHAEAITVMADLPGVSPENLSIDLNDGVLSLTGRVDAPESGEEVEVMREYDTGTFYRQFTLPEAVDQSKIEARLTNGVLRLELPKAEAAKPRRITVKAG